MLPTNHGFDEFFGNLYHLNAEEEPKWTTIRRTGLPKFRQELRPARRDPLLGDRQGRPDEPRWGKVGKQKIEDTGPLTKKRMETCDDDFVAAATDFIKRQNKAGKPFFVWLNTTHMHMFTHTKKGSLGQAGNWQSPYHDTMIDHDKNVGQMLDLLDELGIADDTFVQYSTDNGPHRNTWPDGGMTPFRSEKNTNWEGAFRIPLLVRWPGKIKAGSVSNDIVQHHDWLPTFLAMAGAPDVVEKLKKGYKAIGRTYKNHIDGFTPAVPTGQAKEESAQVLLLLQRRWRHARDALRQLEAGLHGTAHAGTMQVWAEPFTRLRMPKLFNLRTDPYEFADITSNTYYEWFLHNAYFIYAAQTGAAMFAETFKDFPPVQKPNTLRSTSTGQDERSGGGS